MTPERWQKVKEIFEAALERAPDERSPYVASACGEDRSLRREVESLLTAHEKDGSFLDSPAYKAAAEILMDQQQLAAHQMIGHYEIVSFISRGGMGEVYLAQDRRLNRRVALKILPHTIANDSGRLARFEREAFAASALNHPNILTIFEFDAVDTMHFLVTEFVDGLCLRQRLTTGKLPISETLDIAIQIASALQAAHEAGIIHRDIKPDNVMLRADGYVKVLDFGLAKLFQPEAVTTARVADSKAQTHRLLQTETGVIIGTVGYMSPEQTRGQNVDKRTDIWSLGCVLYEMLSGQPPFRGDTIADTLANIIHREPDPILTLRPNTHPELGRIVAQTLAKNADDRYQTAKELLNDLKQLQKRLEFDAEFEHSSASNVQLEPRTEIIRGEPSAQTRSHNSIAVLPFANLSADRDNEYFCDGLAEELLNALAKIEDLRVAARTSAFSFKGKNAEAREVGKLLNVETILEGSVRRSGNRLRITVQLINVSDGYHLWSERYDQEMRDIFDVQDEITLAVVDALKIKLLGKQRTDVLKRYTDNTVAYELYLKGLHHSYKWTDESLRKSLEYFEKALAEDPEFALAYAKIADAYSFSSHVGRLSPNEIIPKWRAAAGRALEIDESLADAHLAMAHIYFYYDRDWAKAEREFQRAIELNPNSAQAHKHYGLFLTSKERFGQAVAEVKKAVELDPLSVAVNFVASYVYFFVDRFDDALNLVHLTRELDPNAPQSHWLEGNLLMATGNYEEAVKVFQKASVFGDNQMAVSMRGCAYGLAGRRDEALKIVDQLFEMREQRYAAPFNIARVYAGIGENDRAFEWMEIALDEHNAELVHLKRLAEAGKGLYLGRSFIADSRYEDILRRVGLPAHAVRQDDASRAQTVRTSSATTDITPPGRRLISGMRTSKLLIGGVLAAFVIILATLYFFFVRK